MIHLVLDSSIFRQKPRLDSLEFKSIAYLAQKNNIRLHVPYFVEGEFVSFLENKQEERIDRAIKHLEAASKYKNTGPATINILELLENVKSTKKEIIIERSRSFIDWLSEINAERYPLNEQETQKALDAYFYGKLPLKEPKVRKDIPDSFIFQTILSLKEEYKVDLYAVIHDNSLREACEKSGLKCFDDLSKFIELNFIQELLKQKLIDDNKVRVFKYIIELTNSKDESILDAVESLLLSDEYRIISGGNVPGESDEIYVSGADRPHSIEYEEVEYFGGSLFIVYFWSLVELTYEFPAFHYDTYDLDRDKYYIGYIDKNFMQIETTDEFRFTGRVELDFDVELADIHDIDELMRKLKVPEVTVSELEEFEINV
ncbi:MAG: DUF4935 domain-containing protein [Deltaproteobacteria bacterium]|nr:DUF4935 domain-containing protein [Deltaproteobacteria bacterium]